MDAGDGAWLEMISHKHKCIFVHCQKCGGESIHLALTDTEDRGSPRKHWTSEQYISEHGQDLWDEYFTFSFVRNPWDRVISWIRYRDKRWKLYGGELNPSIIKEEMNKNPGNSQTASYHYFLFSNCGKILLPKYIGRFENLQEDFNIVCDKIGIPRQELPHKNKTRHKHYTEYYDNETMEIVAEKYAKDIEMFGYEFGK